MENIINIAEKLNLNEDNIETYGKYKAKINIDKYQQRGKLVLVTAMHPTPYGEGKTTISIGINDSLNYLGYKSIAVLREPSLGPVFGLKGGATGGGMASIVPSDDINLHFTGDIHAITCANNLLCSIIDNHIYQGNELNINPNSICVNRVIDMNDRSLRHIKLDNRNESFVITAACELMAIFCLCEDINDLKNRIEKIIIGYNYEKKPIYVKDLNCSDSMILLLKDAIKPNLVQSLENSPVIIHGGPFANVAHGCNSIIATKTGLTLSDYVVTEAGFGADLGAEKFMDIKCRCNLKVDAVVLTITTRAIKHQAGISADKISDKNIDAIKIGIDNVISHINNLKKFTHNILVVLNKFDTDVNEEIEIIKKIIKSEGVEFECSTSYIDGKLGSIEVAKKIVDICNKDNDFNFLYSLEDSLLNKIEKIAREIYHASKVNVDLVLDKLEYLEKNGFNNLPICIAKTPFSFSDNKNLLNNPSNYEITVKDIRIWNGAGFIIIYLNNILTMPGLPKVPNAIKKDF